MTIYSILYLPDNKLRIPAKTVSVFDSALQTLIDDMFATMYHANGIGLAAPQIGIDKRLTVIDISMKGSEQLCLINPEITQREGLKLREEGCLSVPGVYDKVPRALTVTVRALNRLGEPIEISASGQLAHCIQHEVDHLQGKLYVDYLSSLKKVLVRKKLTKYLRKIKR